MPFSLYKTLLLSVALISPCFQDIVNGMPLKTKPEGPHGIIPPNSSEKVSLDKTLEMLNGWIKIFGTTVHGAIANHNSQHKKDLDEFFQGAQYYTLDDLKYMLDKYSNDKDPMRLRNYKDEKCPKWDAYVDYETDPVTKEVRPMLILCPNFYKLTREGQAIVLAHEASHYYGLTFDTWDKDPVTGKYVPSYKKTDHTLRGDWHLDYHKLRKLAPERMMQNAETWGVLLFWLGHNKQYPTDETQRGLSDSWDDMTGSLGAIDKTYMSVIPKHHSNPSSPSRSPSLSASGSGSGSPTNQMAMGILLPPKSKTDSDSDSDHGMSNAMILPPKGASHPSGSGGNKPKLHVNTGASGSKQPGHTGNSAGSSPKTGSSGSWEHIG
ncbi:hypothetical protein CVT24_006063 [Panaeolus cyanescens]|uniref:Lysine-specific metallo-endopeptidase domain-containing protein n=1 Tax=Panaeolus cyanescens TaxID=181874 RepID=A0A409YDW9_9AGAR|nr:hypothetical protein CVT24_006063 [Panaeolus cyanescens]